MREILFRGKRIDNGEWIKGFYVPSCYIENEKPKTHHYIIPMIFRLFDAKGNEIKALNFEECSYKIKVIPETVGQYTGLTDKNGKKIFEGDIVRCKYANAPKNEHIQKVVFFGCKFMAEFSNGGCYSELYDGARHLSFDKSAYMTEIEVIGNLHDNPELLKGGADRCLNDT